MSIELDARLGTGLAMLFAFLAMLFFSSVSVFALGLSLVMASVGWEWARLAGFHSERSRSLASFGFGLLSLFVLMFAGEGETLRWWMLAAALFWLAVAVMLYLQPVADMLEGASPLLLLIGLFVCATAVLAIQGLRSVVDGHSVWLLLYALALVWGMDTGAYFAGRRFGRVKLAPSISPGKTREGVYGGLLVALLLFVVALLFSWGSGVGVKLFLATLFAAVVSVLGDLYESWLKRSAGLKDSGSVLPGHGGVLDRLDGVIAALPVFAFFWLWL